MSTFIGVFLLLIAGVGVVYLGYTTGQEIVQRVKNRKQNKPPTGKK